MVIFIVLSENRSKLNNVGLISSRHWMTMILTGIISVCSIVDANNYVLESIDLSQ